MLVALAIVLASSPLDPYCDPDAGFSVMFPMAPERADHTQVVHGSPTVTHVYTADTEKVGYAVSWSDHPEAATTMPELRLQAARDSVVQGGVVKAETSGKLGGFPSRRITFEKDGARVSFQLVLQGVRLFQAMVVRPAGEDHDTAANTFLDSFALSARATTPPRPPAPRPPAPTRPTGGGKAP